MRVFKKTMKIFFICLFVLVAFAFAAPYIFKGKIISIVKKEINSSLTSKVEFEDVDISFFRHFPKVSVAIENVSIVGTNEFQADTLLFAKSIDASLNVMSVIRGNNYKVYAVNLNSPRIHAIVNKEGRANWDIVKPDTSTIERTTESSPFTLDLQHYAIHNGYIKYDDAIGDMSSEIVNLEHEGTGDFTSDLFTLQTTTHADAVSFTYGVIPYLFNTKTSIKANFEVDNKTITYKYKTDQVFLNGLQLASKGFFQLVNDSTYKMDLDFNAPSTDFRNILSLIPAVYKNDFEKLKTGGMAVFSGFVKGTYSNIEIPAYNISLDVANGFFHYADLPKPVKNINLKLKVDNPDGITDHTVIEIPQAHIELNNDPFDFSLMIKNPVSDMYIDAVATGSLDLSKIAEYIKLETGTKLSGLLDANVNVQGTISAMQKQLYDKFSAGGNINLTDFLYVSKDYPDGMGLSKLNLSFNPRNVTIETIIGQYLKTNFSGTGSIDNLIPYMLKGHPLEGVLNVKADNINLNHWMGTSDTTSAGSSTPFAVPSGINFTVNTQIDNVHYDKVDLKALSGSMHIQDETVRLNNIKANALDGTMAINGSYSTKTDKKNPAISLKYDVKGLDIQKTFLAFNTVQKLMPIGQYLGGKLSSQLSFTGKLGQDMMPDLNSLTGEGNLLLIEGVLKKFAPIEKVAQALNVKDLEAFSLRDVKNFIQFTNGKVLVKPFKIKVKEIDMEIGGMHGFDQSIDYSIIMKLPRSMMGEKGNAYVNSLVSRVNNKGVPLKVGDIVNLNVKMGGSISQPVVTTDLKQTANSLAADFKQQATPFVQQKVDSVKTSALSAVKDTFTNARKLVINSAQDELKKQLFARKDSSSTSDPADTRKKLEESGKGLIDNLNPFKKKKKATDSVKQ